MEFKRNNLAGGDTGVILLAEDRQDDVLLIKKAFAQLSILNPLHVVRDGEELIFYLEGIGRYSNRDEFPLPDLLLLGTQDAQSRWVRSPAMHSGITLP